MKKLIILVMLLMSFAPAYGQKTSSQLSSEVATTLPSNIPGAITAAGVRTLFNDLINSIMPTAPVTAGNLACFNGTTGLLQDCGVVPNVLTIGTSTISGGSNGSILAKNGGVLSSFTVSGDCSVNTVTGSIVCTQTNGVPFGTFATANAATPPAIGSTTPAAGSFSSVTDTAITGSTQCVKANSSGVLSGNVANCAQALTCSTSNWFNTMSSGGIFGCSQPAFSDITGNITTGQLPSIANTTVLANTSGGTAAPSALAPQAFNQGGFTGMAACGYTLADNGGPNFPGGSASTTQFLINQVSAIILCKGAAWVSTAWYADDTAVKILNMIGPTYSLNHLIFDVTLQAGTGSCSATGVSDETHPGCNDVSAPCHVASTPTECTIFVVAKTSTPATINDVGIVGSSRSAQNGPSPAVQAVYPYYAPYARNYTTGQTTFAGETFRWYITKLGSLHTILGDTTLGFGRYTAVASGSTSSSFTTITIPTGFISPNSKNVEFGISNTGAASSLCGVAPYGAISGTNWTTAQLDWTNNPGLTNLFIKTGLMGTPGHYGYVSSVAGCSVYVTSYTDSFGGVP